MLYMYLIFYKSVFMMNMKGWQGNSSKMKISFFAKVKSINHRGDLYEKRHPRCNKDSFHERFKAKLYKNCGNIE